jgi:hypothetical protein
MLRHQNPRKAIRDAKSVKAKQSSNESPIRPNALISLRPLFTPDSITDTGKNVNDIKNLQFTQDQGMLAILANEPMTQPSINSLKRRALVESDPPGSLSKTTDHRIVSNRRKKTKILDESSAQPAKLKTNKSTSADETHIKPSNMNDIDIEPKQILLQSEPRPISHDQLVVDVKDIYADLIMMKAKCIYFNEKQFLKAQEKIPSRQTRLSNKQ